MRQEGEPGGQQEEEGQALPVGVEAVGQLGVEGEEQGDQLDQQSRKRGSRPELADPEGAVGDEPVDHQGQQRHGQETDQRPEPGHHRHQVHQRGGPDGDQQRGHQGQHHHGAHGPLAQEAALADVEYASQAELQRGEEVGASPEQAQHPDDAEQPRVVMEVGGDHRVELGAAPARKVRRMKDWAWLRTLGLLTTRPMIERAPRIIGNIAMKALKASPDELLPLWLEP